MFCRVPRMMLNTRPIGLVFKQHPRDPANVNAWKNMCDPYTNVRVGKKTPPRGSPFGITKLAEWEQMVIPRDGIFCLILLTHIMDSLFNMWKRIQSYGLNLMCLREREREREREMVNSLIIFIVLCVCLFGGCFTWVGCSPFTVAFSTGSAMSLCQRELLKLLLVHRYRVDIIFIFWSIGNVGFCQKAEYRLSW